MPRRAFSRSREVSSAKRCSARYPARPAAPASCAARRVRWRAPRARRGRGMPLGSSARGEGSDAYAFVRLEGDEPECGEPPQRFADRRAADVESLGEKLLPEHGARGDRARDDLVLEDDRNVVGLRGVRHQCGVYGASCILDLCRLRRCRRLRRQRGRRNPEVAAVARDGLIVTPPAQLRGGELRPAEPARRAGEPGRNRHDRSRRPRSHGHSHGSSVIPPSLQRAFR